VVVGADLFDCRGWRWIRKKCVVDRSIHTAVSITPNKPTWMGRSAWLVTRSDTMSRPSLIVTVAPGGVRTWPVLCLGGWALEIGRLPIYVEYRKTIHVPGTRAVAESAAPKTAKSGTAKPLA
jgi:hypothetical protein